MNNTDVIFADIELIFSARNEVLSIPYTEILLFKYDKPYTVVYTLNGRFFYFNIALCAIESHLPYFFVRCNKSIIVNMAQIDHIERNGGKSIFIMKTGDKIAISRSKSNVLFHKFIDYKKDYAYCCYVSNKKSYYK